MQTNEATTHHEIEDLMQDCYNEITETAAYLGKLHCELAEYRAALKMQDALKQPATVTQLH